MESSIKQIKYDFSNAESQKLFEEFTILLAEITKYVEERDQRIVYLEEELTKVTRVRYMTKEILRKLFYLMYRIISYIPRKLLDIIKRIKNKLENILK
ncbi:MAG TPA: hypothetical protein PLW74_00715 [Candidatus Dojkabacteria bacterium]|nr:hypothetical protein [Candidatus Dojkabacteria bacterium]